MDISNGSVLVSKTAQEVIEILPLSRDFVGFKFVGGGDDAEEAGVDGVAGRPEAVIKIWSKSTGFVDPHCPQLEQCIRQAAFQIHIISSQ